MTDAETPATGPAKPARVMKPKKSEIIDGFMIKYHANGVTRWSKGATSDGTVDGIPDGYWEWYRPDGTLKRSGHFANGENVGEWITYDQRGEVYKVTNKKV
jgi:antitoxin component YwqK of YwqJK toxin-antitoxin module